MLTWWNSLEFISALAMATRWLIAVLSIFALVLGARQATLQKETSGGKTAQRATSQTGRPTDRARAATGATAKTPARAAAQNSEVIKLPNGQTRRGPTLSGIPTLSTRELSLATQFLNSGDYAQALKHIQNTVDLEEKSREGAIVVAHGLPWPKMYSLATIIAQKVNNDELANSYAERSTKGGAAENFALYSTTLFKLGRQDEAQKSLKMAVNLSQNKEQFSDLVAKIGLPKTAPRNQPRNAPRDNG